MRLPGLCRPPEHLRVAPHKANTEEAADIVTSRRTSGIEGFMGVVVFPGQPFTCPTGLSTLLKLQHKTRWPNTAFIFTNVEKMLRRPKSWWWISTGTDNPAHK